jgi:hemoglobin
MLLNNKGEQMKTHRMVRFSKTLSLIMAFGLLATTSSMSLAETDRSLYERLGGYDAISAVVDVFLTKVWEDPVVGRFFVGMGTDTRNQLKQKNTNLMCASTGGPCKTINRPLAEAHVGLGITDKEFDIVAGHLGTTLKEFKVPQKEYDELMTKVGGLRDYVVEGRIKK